MIICAVLALITGLLYARFAARAANGFAAALREAEYRKLQQFDFANLDHFSTPSLVTRMTTDVTVMLNAVATACGLWCAARSCCSWGWAWRSCSMPS